MWIEAAVYAIFFAPYLGLICRLHDPNIRKIIYYVELVGLVIATLILIGAAIWAFVDLDSYIKTTCGNHDYQEGPDVVEFGYGNQTFETYDDCQMFFRAVVYSVIFGGLLISLPIGALIVRVLYWGWKQAEYKAIGEAAQRNFLQHANPNGAQGY